MTGEGPIIGPSFYFMALSERVLVIPAGVLTTAAYATTFHARLHAHALHHVQP